MAPSLWRGFKTRGAQRRIERRPEQIDYGLFEVRALCCHLQGKKSGAVSCYGSLHMRGFDCAHSLINGAPPQGIHRFGHCNQARMDRQSRPVMILPVEGFPIQLGYWWAGRRGVRNRVDHVMSPGVCEGVYD